MFGKTLLSIVALLFAGRQFVYASGTTLNACANTVTEGSKAACSTSVVSATDYCIEGTSIYVLTAADTIGCSVTLKDNAVNIVKLDNNDSSVISSTISGIDITNPDIKGKLAVVDCLGSNCIQVTGILKDKNDFFTIDAAAGATTSVTKANDKEYLVFDGNDKAIAYVYDEGESDFVKNTGRNAPVSDNVCVDANSVIWKRKDALCDTGNAECKYYYDCDNGECSLSRLNKRAENEHVDLEVCNPEETGREKCGKGYHITNEAGTALAVTGKLWYCGDEQCDSVENGIGYFETTDEGVAPYIYCVVSGGSQSCSKATIIVSDCSAIGQLRSVTDAEGATTYNLCLAASGSGIPLADVTGSQLIATIDKTDGLYGIKPNTLAAGKTEANDQFYLALAVEGNNVKVVKESTPVRYKYTDGNTGTTLYKGNANSDDICQSGSPYEYKLVQWEATLENDFADFYVDESYLEE